VGPTIGQDVGHNAEGGVSTSRLSLQQPQVHIDIEKTVNAEADFVNGGQNGPAMLEERERDVLSRPTSLLLYTVVSFLYTS